MENKTIRIGLSSVLIYLIFKKSYSIMTKLLIWLNVKLKIENVSVVIVSNIIIGILSLFLLILLYNRFLKREIPKNKTVYSLVFITVILTIIVAAINYFYGNYLSNIVWDNFRTIYLLQLGWLNTLDIVFPVFGMIYFLWKLLTDKKHSDQHFV